MSFLIWMAGMITIGVATSIWLDATFPKVSETHKLISLLIIVSALMLFATHLATRFNTPP